MNQHRINEILNTLQDAKNGAELALMINTIINLRAALATS